MDTDMQITLNQDEIEDAIRSYVGTQIALTPGMTIGVELRAGRGENGFTATLDIKHSNVGFAQKSKPNFRSAAAEADEDRIHDMAKPEPEPEPPVENQTPEPEPAKQPAKARTTTLTKPKVVEETAPEETEEDPMTSADNIPDTPDEEAEEPATKPAAEEAPRKPSIFQFANKTPAE